MNTATNTNQKKPSFVQAMKTFFGFRNGDGLSQFTAELKELTDEDKQYFHSELGKVGIDCEAPLLSTKVAAAA